MKIIKNLLVLILVSVGFTLSAQNYSAENSLKFIVKGIEYHKDGKYSSAIKEYEKVHRNDTNYAIALYEISLSYVEKEDYERAIETCEKGLAEKSDYDNAFYTTMGTAYSESKKYDKAVETYSRGLKQFPKNSSLKYNKAVALLRAKKYEEGLNLVYENIRENPFHTNSHFLLGNICADRELHSQAILAYNMALIVGDGEELDLARLQYIDGYLNGAMDGDDEYEDIDFLGQGYEDLDELVSNKVAVASKYTTPSKLEFPIIKQTHFLLSSLDEVSSTDGFWNEYYAPFFKKIIDEGQFGGYSYYLVRSGNGSVASITKQYSKKASEVQRFKTWFANGFADNFGKREVDGKVKQYHYSEDYLVAIGDYEDEEYIGDWEFFYNNGALSRVGSFKDNEKQGVWKSYYNNGVLKNSYTYIDGEPNGPFSEYNNKGILTREGNFKDALYEGPIKYYFETGGLEKMQEFKKGVLDGKLEYYFKNGEKSVEATVEEGSFEGDIIFYGVNGQKTQQKPYVNDELNGLKKTWYMNGKIRSEINYKDDKLDGSYVLYYKNGQIQEERKYSEGSIIGKTTSYHENGKVKSEEEYDESGKENGVSTSYFDNGDVFSKKTFKKGILSDYVFYDKEGNELSKGSKSGKTIDYVRYDENGYLYSKGKYLRGEQDGEWSYYYAGLEVPMNKLNYTEGKQNGTQQYFYSNGQLRKEYDVKDGNTEGELVEYLLGDEDIVTYSGFYEDDEPIGEFVTKNALEKITKKSYYKVGVMHGWQEYYTEKGMLASESYFNENTFYGTVYYDSLGNVRDSVWLKNGTGEFRDSYADGSKRFIGNYKNGEADGSFTWYFPNGKVRTKGQYVNGEKNGEWLNYYESGKLKYKYTYNYGDLEGKYFNYYEDGTVEIEANYKYGEKEGAYTRYFWNGKKRIESFYKNDELNGECKYYVPTGDLAIIRTYIEDILVSYSYMGKDNKPVKAIPVTGKKQTVQAFFANGTKSVEYTLESNEYTGNFSWYYPTGKVYRSSNYKSGLLDGKMEAFAPSGYTLYTWTYKSDEANGLCIDYHPKSGKLKSKYNYYMGDREGKALVYDQNGNLKSTRYYFNDTYYGGNF